MTLLKFALGANATLSSTTGLGLVFFHKSIATFFGTTMTLPFLLIGLGLLYFCATTILEIYKERRTRILWIIIQDVIWVAASAYLLIIRPLAISAGGYTSIAIIAVLVLLMAILQWLGITQTKRSIPATV